MAYWGGGLSGQWHPSLRTYVECFHSPPFPKRFPRDGGVWDQDPELMRDFRVIREYEVQWRDAQEKLREAESGQSGAGPATGLSGALDQYTREIQELEDGG